MRKLARYNDIDLEEYGFGDWLKENAGTILGATGAALGTVLLPGVGTAVGASLGSGIGKGVEGSNTKDETEEEMLKQERINSILARSDALKVDAGVNMPVFPEGGGLGTKSVIGNRTIKGSLLAAIRDRYNTYTNKTNKAEMQKLAEYLYNMDSSGLEGRDEFKLYSTDPVLKNFVNDPTTRGFLKNRGFGTLDLEEPAPSFRKGGYIIDYKGPKHNRGGITVDAITGNPVPRQMADAEVEGKEMGVKFPGEETPYIFSDKLGYADKARKVVGKYSRRKNYKISRDAMFAELGGLLDEQEEVREKKAAYHADQLNEEGEYKKGGWIKKAVNPSHRGYCTPMTKSTCTPRRKALARTFKKHHGFHEDGGELFELASGGGLSRAKDYGSSKKPYPSVKSSDFAGGGRSYPIPTKADAMDALRLAGLHSRSDVKAKVYAKYPELKKGYGGYFCSGGRMRRHDYGDWLGDSEQYEDIYAPNVIDNTPTTEAMAEVDDYSPYRGSYLPAAMNIGANIAGAVGSSRASRNFARSYRGAPDYMPETIDLADTVQMLKEQAANRLGTLKSSTRGLSPGQRSAILASYSDKDINDAIRETMLNEATTNADIRNRARMYNIQKNVGEDRYKRETKEFYRQERNKYLSNIADTLTSVGTQRQMYDVANMLNPYYEVTEAPDANIIDRILGTKPRIRPKR